MYLDDINISFRAKGILAALFHYFPKGRCTHAEFKEKFNHPYMNAEYLLKFTNYELKKEGYLSEDSKNLVFSATSMLV